MPLTDALAYWSMDDAGTWADATANVLDLSQAGTVTGSTGKVGDAAVFPGTSSDYLSQAGVLTAAGGGSFSLMGWLWLDATGSYVCVYDCLGGGRQWSLFINGTT